MKRLALSLFALLMFASMMTGCMSTGFLGFIATTDSVDAKIAERDAAARAEMDGQQARMDAMARELKELQAMKDQSAKAVSEAEQSRKTVEELKALIARLEARLEALPEQSLRMLIDILQASLEPAEREKK